MSRGGSQTSKFGLRDLGTLLPDEVGSTHSFGVRDKTADAIPDETLKPAFNPSTKVRRYFAGKAPEWARKEQDDDSAGEGDGTHEDRGQGLGQRKPLLGMGGAKALKQRFLIGRRKRRETFQAELIVEEQGEEVDEDSSKQGKSPRHGKDTDSDESEDESQRARARAQARARARSRAHDRADGEGEGEGRREDTVTGQRAAGHRRSAGNGAKEKVEGGDLRPGDVNLSAKVDAETEEDILARRNRIRSRLRQTAEAQELEQSSSDDDEEMPRALSEQEEEGEEDDRISGDDSSSGSWETDSDFEEDGPGSFPMKKPTFVPRSQRLTLQEREKKEAEQEAKMKAEQDRLEQRKHKTRQLVVDEIQAEADDMEAEKDEDANAPDDTDDPNDLEEFEQWKVRELTRLKRDRDTRRKVEIERAEIERRRAMTDEERRKEDEELIKAGLKKDPNAPKQKLGYLQKYYHKGAFYMDDDSIRDKSDVRLKDYNEPTLEDHFNKKALPKILQVKNFGKIGRTKYTHLTDQDTTDFDNPFMQKSKARDNALKRRAGQHGDLDQAGRVKRNRKGRHSR